MRRVLVGTDGSAGSANAMRWAARVARARQAELICMTGFVPTESELPPDRVEHLLGEAASGLDTWSEVARAEGADVRCIVERGDPRSGILAVAAREDVDLVVVGRVGTSAGPGLLHIGSMAEWLAHHVDRPTAIVGGAVNLEVRSVLVGLDGSEGAAAAVAWLGDFASGRDISIFGASVQQPFVESEPADSADDWRRAVERRIATDDAASLVAAGHEVRPVALRGSNAADLLLGAAQDERVDLIVVGTRGLGGFSGLRVGGVTLKVLHRADRPVVMVPPG